MRAAPTFEWWIVAASAVARTASADPIASAELDAAIARHAEADVATLAAHADEPAARCALGVVYFARKQLPRAQLALTGCDVVSLPPALADRVAAATAATSRALRASDLSELSIVTTPVGGVVDCDALPGEVLLAPATIWAPAGTYHLRAALDRAGLAQPSSTATVTLAAHSRSAVVLALATAAAPPPRNGSVDFGEEPTEAATQGDPPAVQHKSLMPKKFVDGGTTSGQPQLDDPFPIAGDAPPAHPPERRLGVRIGGVATSHAGGSRLGPSVALVAGAIAPWLDASADELPLAFAARLDWSRRGGDDAPVDVVAGELGIAQLLASTDELWFGANFAVRGVGRLGDAMSVHRAGFDVAAGLDVVLRRLPVSLGVRFEQGVTPLVGDARERALVFELGGDLRVFHRAE